MEAVSPYWFIRLDRLWRFGRIWLGILVFLILTLLFAAMFGIMGNTDNTDNTDNTEEAQALLGICLFFASINATALVGTMAIIERSQLTIDQLKPLLGTDTERFAAIRAALSGAPRKWLWSVTFISLAAGLLHTLTVNSANAAANFNVPSAGASLGTMLTWFIQLHAIAALVRTAHL